MKKLWFCRWEEIDGFYRSWFAVLAHWRRLPRALLATPALAATLDRVVVVLAQAIRLPRALAVAALARAIRSLADGDALAGPPRCSAPRARPTLA